MAQLIAALAAVLVLTTPAGAPAPHHPDASLDGAAASRVGAHTRILAIDARGDRGGVATGDVRFVHHSPDGVNRFLGVVSCLRRGGTGTAEISGTVSQGQNTAGTDLAGRDFAFTLHTAGNPQRFSRPRFAAPATRPSCRGGRTETVPVTVGGFHSRP